MSESPSEKPIDPASMPRHVAIIMDGNGRWAQARGLPRTMGHRAGSEALKRTIRAAVELKIPYVTIFGFSSENWNRPAEEISELMRILRMGLRSETAELHGANIRLKMIGDRDQLDPDIVEMIENAEKLTSANTGLTLTVALNYGGRMDILQAASRWAMMCREKGIEPDRGAAEEYFPLCLLTAGTPDPDILIRTSGEERISNFLLWQCAYAELFFTPVLWPDFSRADLESILREYAGRERRFGKVGAK